MAESDFVEHVLELMAPMGDVRARKMFGGYGFFTDDRMFALVSRDGTLYLRTGDSNRDAYLAEDLPQFMNMPYHAAPAEALDDSEIMCAWAVESRGVAATAKKKKAPAKKAAKKAPAKKAPAKKTASQRRARSR